MRTLSFRSLPILVLLMGAFTLPAYAGSLDEHPADQQSIDALETRASQASPREQCFLYAELVHEMVEFSAQQYANGEVDKSISLLKRAQDFAHKIQSAVSLNDKKLKDTQILLRHAAFRLTELIHSSNSEDHPVMSDTLAQLNAAQNDTMMAVFKK